MGKDPYSCTGCKKTFSRKSNAERHNRLIHNEMAIVFNKETGRLANKNKESKLSSLTSSFSPFPFPSDSKTATTDTNNNNTVPPTPNLFPNDLKDFNVDIPYPKINIKTDENKFFKIFEKTSPLIDELDALLLSTYVQNIDRIQLLSTTITSALMSQNPVNVIKAQINFYRSLIGIKKASGFVAASHNISLDQAKDMLKTIILSAPYSKNKFDNQI